VKGNFRARDEEALEAAIANAAVDNVARGARDYNWKKMWEVLVRRRR